MPPRSWKPVKSWAKPCPAWTFAKWTKRTCSPLAVGNLDRTHTSMKIGILSVQGDFAAHTAMLKRLGVQTAEVRTTADLTGCDALILPGGESSTQLQFLKEERLFESIRKFANKGGGIFGTCAGAILLAKDVQNPPQDSLGILDMTVTRNAYGRQMASDIFFGKSHLSAVPLEM